MDHLAYRLRVTDAEQGSARIRVRRHQLTVGRPLDFDLESGHMSTLECVLGAMGAELVTGLRAFAARRRIEIDAVESVVEGRIEHPLTYLEVVGEAGQPRISAVGIKVYVASPHDQASIRQLWNDTIERLPLVVTFARAFDLHLELAITN
jgi:hypothetical protein